MSFRPGYDFSARGARVLRKLFIHPLLHAGCFHKLQILNDIFMMYDTVFNVDGNEILKAPTRKLVTFIAARYALFPGAFSKPMTAISTSFRHPVGKASSALLRK
jgi:hypothetical protein